MTTLWRCEKTSDPIQDRNNSVLLDIISALSSKVKSLTESKVQPVSVDQVKQLLQPQNLVKHFQSGGDAPLNLTGLIGVTGSPQIAGIPILSALPAANDPAFIHTAAVVVSGVLYINQNGTFVGSTVGLTSIALAMPAGFGVAGSPLIANGTITVSIANAATVRADIGAAKSGDNIDITSLINGILIGGAGGIAISSGSGAPNGSVTGNIGDLYCDQTGTAGLVLWVKETGTGTDLGWVGK